MSQHYITRCRRCDGVVSQCRCIPPCKTVRYVEACWSCILKADRKPALSTPHQQEGE